MPSACTQRWPSSAPSSSPMATSSSRLSLQRPAYGLSMTAIASALRVGGEMARPISERTSSTWTTILRILAGMAASFSFGAGASALAVPFADVGGLETADAGVHARAGAHGQDEDD